MVDNLRKQIYNNLNHKGTDELLEIWQTNDHMEWSNETFEVIKEILGARGIDIPVQDEPIYVFVEENIDTGKRGIGFSALELKIIDDQNPPDFYEPLEALKIGKWLDLAAKAMIILTVLVTLLAFPAHKNAILPFFLGDPNSPFVVIGAIFLMALNIVIVVPLYYFPLQALSQMLRILMEMEFNSRKVG